MKILAIDTTTRFLCIGTHEDGKICGYNLELGKMQSELLIPTIKRVCDVMKWRLKEIDYFACGLGPGSFTGIRVGLGVIKGLSWSLNKPIIGVSSLDVLALNAGEFSGTIVPIIDAKRSLIYCSAYKNTKGILRKILPESLIDKTALFKKIKPGSIFLGDGLGLYKHDIIENVPGAICLERDYWQLKPHNLIAAVLENLQKKKITDTFRIKPIYLYPDECQIKKPSAISRQQSAKS
ncbi:MAG: tRNA (adenosine(37)-N6)-threonylcarbamoyltransferase complex dimerization subunit type 1 TsaB [Candidatus Omnitrophica bacterium]|jgi:tRNA threonylcarbamoyladenosine biosynthesis protein TsaB|nr:tRNA (adenosine(37)-N6)-threonylcarbamoyltransferase complex dimerization subunit type 1 TsaB [Candidatus Omnitrophota bacterium]